MNWLLLVIVLLLIICPLHGYKKGFLKMSISFVCLILTLVLSSILTPVIGGFLQNHTPLYGYVKTQSVKAIDSYVSGSGSGTDGNQLIEGLNLPQSVKSVMADSDAAAIGNFAVSQFSDLVGGYIAKWIINTIAYIFTFLVIGITLKILTKTLGIVSKLPVIRGVNRLAGLVLGLLQGVLVMWVFFIAITLFASTGFGRSAFRMINESVVLSFLYETNYLMQIILRFITG